MRRRRAEEADTKPARARRFAPSAFVLVINQRGQDERQVAVHGPVVPRDVDVVARAGEDGGQITDVYARQVEKDAAHVFGEVRDGGVGAKARAVTAGDRVFVSHAILGP